MAMNTLNVNLPNPIRATTPPEDAQDVGPAAELPEDLSLPPLPSISSEDATPTPQFLAAAPVPQPAAPVPTFAPTQTKTTVTEDRKVIPAADRAAIDAAAKKQVNALTLMEEAERAANDVKIETNRAQAEELRVKRENYDSKIEAKQRELDDDIKFVANSRLDRGRIWKNASTSDRIMANVALLVGAVGQAADGQDNPAVKAMQSAIDKDIDAQKFDLLNRKDLLQEKKSLLGQLIADRNYSLNEAADLMKAGLYASTSKTLSDASLRQEAAGNKVLAAKYAQAAAALATESAAKRADMNASQVRKVTETEAVKPGQEKDYFSALPDERTRRDLENSLAAVKSSDRLYKFIKDNPSASKGMGVFATNLAKIKDTFGQIDPADAATRARFEQAVANAGRAALGAGVLTEQDMIFAARLAPSFGNNLEANLALAKGLGDNARAEANDFFNTREDVGVRTPPGLKALVAPTGAASAPSSYIPAGKGP